MIVSLNEAEGMATKAAWGAGRPWGLAQEAGRAVSGLEAMQLPGAKSLVDLLVATDRIPCERMGPVSTTDGVWRGEGPLCPILTGAYISDGGGEDFCSKLHDVHTPLLLVPFARLPCASVRLAWEGASIVANLVEASIEGSVLSTSVVETVLVTPMRSSKLDPGTITHEFQLGAVDIADEIWEALSVFAHRTYVPATEASRLKGAGAGLTDND